MIIVRRRRRRLTSGKQPGSPRFHMENQIDAASSSASAHALGALESETGGISMGVSSSQYELHEIGKTDREVKEEDDDDVEYL